MNLPVITKPSSPNLPLIKRREGEGREREGEGRSPKESREKQKKSKKGSSYDLGKADKKTASLQAPPSPPQPQMQAAFCDIAFPPRTFNLHPHDLWLRRTSKAEEGRVWRSEPHSTRDGWSKRLPGHEGEAKTPGDTYWDERLKEEMLLAWTVLTLPGEGNVSLQSGCRHLMHQHTCTLIFAGCHLCVLEQIRLLCVIAWWNILIHSVNTNYTVK